MLLTTSYYLYVPNMCTSLLIVKYLHVNGYGIVDNIEVICVFPNYIIITLP